MHKVWQRWLSAGVALAAAVVPVSAQARDESERDRTLTAAPVRAAIDEASGLGKSLSNELGPVRGSERDELLSGVQPARQRIASAREQVERLRRGVVGVTVDPARDRQLALVDGALMSADSALDDAVRWSRAGTQDRGLLRARVADAERYLGAALDGLYGRPLKTLGNARTGF